MAGEVGRDSPTSVAIALAMLEPGTVDEAQQELRALLRITDPAAFHSSMGALELDLESRLSDKTDIPDGDEPANEKSNGDEITIRITNAAYLQEGYPFTAQYLNAIGTSYGPVLHEVDFASNPDAVARAINASVADATNDRITDLIADGVIERDTALALVNALYFDAVWLNPFEESASEVTTFTSPANGEVAVDMMQGVGDSSASGEHWVGATKAYPGGLYAQFILPDEGEFNGLANNLSAVFEEYEAPKEIGYRLHVPRFEIGANVKLDAALQSIGLQAPYDPGGLIGIANDPRLFLDKTIHETYVRMDESGTEGAAATVGLSRSVSRSGPQPIPVVLDRPFLYRIVDSTSGATLFVGQVTDPTVE